MGRFVSSEGTFDSGVPGNTVSFVDITNKPTTLAGYGITDGAVANNIDFNSIVNKPTSFAGYGITDVGGLTVDFTDVINRPTTLAGYGITDAATVGSGGEITSLPFGSITNTPTDIAGYGITDAVSIGTVTSLVNTAVTDAIAAGGGGGTALEAPTVIDLNGESTESLLPTAPVQFSKVIVIVTNGFLTNSLNGNGNTIMGSTTPLVLDIINLPICLQFINNDWKLV